MWPYSTPWVIKVIPMRERGGFYLSLHIVIQQKCDFEFCPVNIEVSSVWRGLSMWHLFDSEATP